MTAAHLEFQKTFATEIAEIPDDQREVTLDAPRDGGGLAGPGRAPPAGRTIEQATAAMTHAITVLLRVPPPDAPSTRLGGAADPQRRWPSRLGVHYMTAYRYLRTGRPEGTKHGTEWRRSGADLAQFEAQRRPPQRAPGGTGSSGGRGDDSTGRRRAPRRSRRRIDWAGRAGADDRRGRGGAWSVIENATGAGMAIEDVYLQLLDPGPAIGRRPMGDGEITVADEHVASAITLRLIGRLDPSSPGGAASAAPS